MTTESKDCPKCGTRIHVDETCPRCTIKPFIALDGYAVGVESEVCETCNGKGEVHGRSEAWNWKIFQCQDCNGTGLIEKRGRN